MVSTSMIIAFIATTNPTRARAFLRRRTGAGALRTGVRCRWRDAANLQGVRRLGDKRSWTPKHTPAYFGMKR